MMCGRIVASLLIMTTWAWAQDGQPDEPPAAPEPAPEVPPEAPPTPDVPPAPEPPPPAPDTVPNPEPPPAQPMAGACGEGEVCCNVWDTFPSEGKKRCMSAGECSGMGKDPVPDVFCK